MTIILASASERRRRLLSQAGFVFTAAESGFDESGLMNSGLLPDELTMLGARGKAAGFADISGDVLIIAADTVVFLDGKIFGKPKNENDARSMLRALSGNTHTVYTGVALVLRRENGEETVRSFCDTAVVEIAAMSDEEIEDYVLTGEPMGRAGSYTLDERGSMLVKNTNGSFSTVLGLPMHRLYDELKALGINPFRLS